MHRYELTPEQWKHIQPMCAGNASDVGHHQHSRSSTGGRAEKKAPDRAPSG